MNPFIDSLANAMGPTIATATICLAVSAAAYIYQSLLQRLPTAMRAHITDLADTAVRAIEQKYKDNSPGGTMKKQEAMQMLLNMCQALKLPLDATHASAAVDAAVFALNQFTTPTTTQPQTREKPTMPMPTVTTKSKTMATG